MTFSRDKSFALASTEDLFAPIDALLGDLFATIDGGAGSTAVTASIFAGVTKSEALGILRDTRRFALLRLVAARFLVGRDPSAFALDAFEQDLEENFNVVLRLVLDELGTSCLEVRLKDRFNPAKGNPLCYRFSSDISDSVFEGFETDPDLARDTSATDRATDQRGDVGAVIIPLHDYASRENVDEETIGEGA
ncbi:hypothetical protein [uncultured Roseibium sp.]|uniref:hypothetical protein n=1 Tax=uncultured Roseibium sp. TaxID=1936171 RepID=UPI00262CE9AF|nr:hypothetical protein [uncultured Roseibium sp.]